MILTKEQKEQFEEAVKPLMKYLAENHHPHVKAIVESSNAEILEGSASIATQLQADGFGIPSYHPYCRGLE